MGANVLFVVSSSGLLAKPLQRSRDYICSDFKVDQLEVWNAFALSKLRSTEHPMLVKDDSATNLNSDSDSTSGTSRHDRVLRLSPQVLACFGKPRRRYWLAKRTGRLVAGVLQLKLIWGPSTSFHT